MPALSCPLPQRSPRCGLQAGPATHPPATRCCEETTAFPGKKRASEGTGWGDVGEPESEHSVTRLRRQELLKRRASRVRQMCPAPFLLQPAAPLQKETAGTVSPDNSPGNHNGFLAYVTFSDIILSLELGTGWQRYPGSSATRLACLHDGPSLCRLLRSSPSAWASHPHPGNVRADQEESSASKPAPTALSPTAERSVKSTGTWAEVFSPGSSHCEQWGTENEPNENQFCFSLTELGKGRRGSIPGLSTTVLTIDKSRSWRHGALFLTPRAPCPSSLKEDICIVGNPNLVLIWGARLCPMFVEAIPCCETGSNSCPKGCSCVSANSKVGGFFGE